MVKFSPDVHLTPIDIAYNVINILQSSSTWTIVRFPFYEPWQENAMIVPAFDKNMHGFTIGMNARNHHFTLSVICNCRLHIGPCTSLYGLFKGFTGIINPKCHHFYPVTMQLAMVCNRRIRNQCSCHDKRDFSLPDNIAGAVFQSGFKPGISQWLKAEGTLIIVCSLLGIAHIKFNIIGTVNR